MTLSSQKLKLFPCLMNVLWLNAYSSMCFLAVNQTASTIPKTWRKPNDGISASDALQKEDEVCK